MTDDESKNGDAEELADDEYEFVEADGFEDDGSSGLEVDDGQAREVERIFLTTLPQYLEPVEEMVDQLMAAGEDPGGEIRRALGATLSSLSAAASRMGIEEIFERLDRLSLHVEQLDLDAGPPPAEARHAIYAELEAIGSLVIDGDGGAGGSATESSPTIFSALAGVEGIDDSVLSKLTAAGLVNVEQLRIADADEVVAVSGLDPAVVANILAAVGAPAAAPVEEVERVEEVQEVEPVETAKVVELPLDEGALRSQLGQRLRAQVDAEVAVDETAAEVQRLRARAQQLRADLREAQRRRDDRQRELARTGERLSEQMAARGRLRARRGELALEITAAEQRWRNEETRMERLRRDCEAARTAQVQFGREVAGLADRVRRLLETAQRR